MAPLDPTEARFRAVPQKAGHCESFYLTLCHPDEALGAWIRYELGLRERDHGVELQPFPDG